MTFSKEQFFNSDLKNRKNNYQIVTLANFAKFHSQTTKIQPFKVECFSTKTLKFRDDDVIISDISGDFEMQFAMSNRLGMSYLCTKFCFDTTLAACKKSIFHVYFLYFSTNQQRF